MTVSFINAWGILIKGGAMMWPLALLSVLAITVGIEKFLYLIALEKGMKKFKAQFLQAVRENRMKDAFILCEDEPLGVGSIFKEGLMKFGSSPAVIKTSMEEAAGFEIHGIKQRLSLLAFIVNAAPLLGLLGTTTALCVVFHAAQLRSNALNPLSLGDMSSGIWQALLTTSAGLSVGIVSYAIYGLTLGRVNQAIAALDQSIIEAAGILQAAAETTEAQRGEGA